MLVCNVSLRAPRGAIAAEIAESVAALDTQSPGVVWAGLVDEPAAANATTNALLGLIIAEAASANTALDAGTVFAAAIVENTTAISAQNGAVPGIQTGTVAEAASAQASQDAS